ncbi:MAG: glycoside hydrolase family 172 protein [Bryobacteraceae bacterium]|nr:glycoside hydrolase family 172 protein [Bryobacteraceae bacterium]
MKTLLFIAFASLVCAQSSDLARKRPGVSTRWATFENRKAGKGAGGAENKGAKGRPFEAIAPGETKTLLDIEGSGEIRRMWFTIQQRDPEMLRSLLLEMYWDGAKTPAVAVPVGDFFGAILGRAVRFENELFSNPEGRSFNLYIPMPFRRGARVTLRNESTRPLPYLFYDIDFLLTPEPDPDALYFHAIWRRSRWNKPGEDFEFLPKVSGAGRFLGAHFGVITHPDNTGWWGEGEVKIWVDGDSGLPTIVGTGTEDYIGTGWGQGVYANRFQGCLVADEKAGQYTFYRYHVPDPVYFDKDLRATIQVMGGDRKDRVIAMLDKGVPVTPVTIDVGGKLVHLLESGVDLRQHQSPPESWVNVYRRDDWSAVALFYLDAPENGLPAVAPAAVRTEGLK